MWNISLVGHAQLPQSLSVKGTEIRIFRAPGGRAGNFCYDRRMSEVLEWQHDLCILWLGSNDIYEGVYPKAIANDIISVVHQIEGACQAVVHVCLVEPRLYPREEFMSHVSYRKIQRAINKTLQKHLLCTQFLQFNSNSWEEELVDGIHWSAMGKQRVSSKIRRAVKNYIGVNDSNTE